MLLLFSSLSSSQRLMREISPLELRQTDVMTCEEVVLLSTCMCMHALSYVSAWSAFPAMDCRKYQSWKHFAPSQIRKSGERESKHIHVREGLYSDPSSGNSVSSRTFLTSKLEVQIIGTRNHSLAWREDFPLAFMMAGESCRLRPQTTDMGFESLHSLLARATADHRDCY